MRHFYPLIITLINAKGCKYLQFCQNFVFKKRRDHEKNSNGRLVYESVDDKSLSYALSQYLTGIKASGSNGVNYSHFNIEILQKFVHLQNIRGNFFKNILNVYI